MKAAITKGDNENTSGKNWRSNTSRVTPSAKYTSLVASKGTEKKKQQILSEQSVQNNQAKHDRRKQDDGGRNSFPGFLGSVRKPPHDPAFPLRGVKQHQGIYYKQG